MDAELLDKRVSDLAHDLCHHLMHVYDTGFSFTYTRDPFTRERQNELRMMRDQRGSTLHFIEGFYFRKDFCRQQPRCVQTLNGDIYDFFSLDSSLVTTFESSGEVNLLIDNHDYLIHTSIGPEFTGQIEVDFFNYTRTLGTVLNASL